MLASLAVALGDLKSKRGGVDGDEAAPTATMGLAGGPPQRRRREAARRNE